MVASRAGLHSALKGARVQSTSFDARALRMIGGEEVRQLRCEEKRRLEDWKMGLAAEPHESRLCIT